MRPGEVDYELIFGLMGLGLLAAAWAFPYWSPYYRQACPLKTVTDGPCLLCGGTRSMSAWTRGRVAESFKLNPLAASLGVFLTIYAPYALGATALRARRRLRPAAPSRAIPRWRPLAVRLAAVAVLALNWAYLIRVGR
jgi:hypothetical protein